MRVIAGEFKSRQLKGAPGQISGLRPTSDRVRENVFNMLGPIIEGAAFLDLFAGTGAVGVEALSRGARSAVFVESNAAALRTIRDNVSAFGLGGRVEIVSRDVAKWLQSAGRPGRVFDVVYMDPPYASGVQLSTLEILGRGGLLGPDAVVILERKEPVDADCTGVLRRTDSRKYGKTHIEIWQRNESMNGSG
jgi:16S rRNA (guanine(966)-N(2))-methyltransferase RsmD